MKFANIDEITKKHGKHDLERLGLFMEMPYLSPKSRAIQTKTKNLGRNFLGGTTKSKCGTSDGYFDEFKRIFSKEAIKGRGRKQPISKSEAAKKPPLKPSGASKRHSTPGDYYGCFSGAVAAFSSKATSKPPHQPSKKNFLTNPARKGGPGYVDICLNKYPEHMNDRYGRKLKENTAKPTRPFINAHRTQDYFDKNPYYDKKATAGPTYVRPKERQFPMIKPGRFMPAGPTKLQGGCHAGCFQPLPEHKSDRIIGKKVVKKEIKPFYPQSTAMKTLNHRSILTRNVDFRVNAQNYKDFTPSYLKYAGLN